jgi:hypothetical protein
MSGVKGMRAGVVSYSHGSDTLLYLANHEVGGEAGGEADGG